MTMTTVLRYAAFTDAGRGGNPAGVVLDAGDLDPEARVRIAADVGYSETAFVEPTQAPQRYRVRYFSPLAEVAFCGHATIATAVALADRDGPGRLVLETLAGEIVVDTSVGVDGVSATLTSPATRTREATAAEVDDALDALGWAASAMDDRYPAHVAFAGEHHLVLAVAERATLAGLDYDFERLGKVMAARHWITLQLVHAEDSNTFHARNPFPPGGVVEDPATGAAAAAFGGYLRALGLVDLPARVVIHQGEDMGRPSLLVVDLAADDDRVRVTGTAGPIC